MTGLLDSYSGAKAVGYDARRTSSPRWTAEVAAMDRMLAALRPGLVLDCPFGTGRWIAQYRAVNARVIGIDLSAGMLEEARAKLAVLPETERAAFDLRLGSIFDLVPEPDAAVPDLVACIPFLNWIGPSEAEAALTRLTALGAPAMIAGVSVIPQDAGTLRRMWFRLSLALLNTVKARSPRQYVHDEVDVLALFARLGWTVAERAPIMRRHSRVNFFWRLARTPA